MFTKKESERLKGLVRLLEDKFNDLSKMADAAEKHGNKVRAFKIRANMHGLSEEIKMLEAGIRRGY